MVPSAPVAKPEQAEELTLATAIAKALRNNPELSVARLTLESAELAHEDAWAKMFLPGVNLNLNAASNYTVGQVPGSPATAPGTSAQRDHGTPSSGANVQMGSYTLFNFGKDRDAYDQARLDIERSRQVIHEAERRTRFDTINGVFQLKTQQDLLDIAQRSVDAAQSIQELVKSRIPLGRATENDLASADIDLLNAKNQLNQAQLSYNQALWQLNYVLGDPIDHSYNVRAAIKYIKFHMPLEDVVRIFKENAPAVRDARKNLEKQRLSVRIAEKNALPLPQVTFSGVTIGSTYATTGTSRVRDSGINGSSGNNGNLDVSASINFTIPLVGAGGFLSSRALRAAEIAEEQAELQLRQAGNQGEQGVRNLYSQIVVTESTIENNEKLLQKSLNVFEAALQSLQTKGTTNRLDLKDAISQLRTSEQAYTQSVVQHYSLKTNLAATIGVDRYPEENL